MSGGDFLSLILLGAIIGLDMVSFPQAMISRPLVAATLAGWVLGSPERGLLIGATLELIALETMPVGASRYPEWGSASVVGGALFALLGDVSAGALPVSMLAALATAWAGGWTMVSVRRLNGLVARQSRASLERGSRAAVTGVQLAGLAADFVRGGMLTLVALVALMPIARASVEVWQPPPMASHATVVAIATAVAAAAVWKLFHGTAHARLLFVGGLVGGLIILA
jgi:mannose/fructose/N-acetylgalactosamine-specific phosphotransferase system component IIC